MVQNKFDKYLIDKPFIINNKTKNKVLYEISNATTDNQKTVIRKRKRSLLEKIKKGTINPPGDKSKRKKLSSDDLERRLINALDSQPNNANLLGKAIDFFIKVKSKSESMEEDFDMEALKRLGVIAKGN